MPEEIKARLRAVWPENGDSAFHFIGSNFKTRAVGA
jgi:hypothetical protein